MVEETLLEKLVQANHDYHEAVDGILASGEWDTKTKASFGCATSRVFQFMERAEQMLTGQEKEGGE